MAQPNIVLSLEAQGDLAHIQRRIAKESGIARALRVRERILKAVHVLAFTPGIGRSRPFLARGALAFPVSPWLVIYKPLPTLDGIEIMRVVDSRRNLPAVL